MKRKQYLFLLLFFIGVELYAQTPNPIRDKVAFDFDAAMVRNIKIIDRSGEIVRSYISYNANFEIDLSFLSKGIYFYIVVEDREAILSGKLVKQ